MTPFRPGRRPFLHAATVISEPPRHCVVVEDSPAGVEAARAAGMRVIGCCALSPAALLSEADALGTTMTGLPAAIAAL